MDINNYIKNNHLKIIVRPNSNKNEIIEFNEDKRALKVNIAAPADKNKANKEVIKFFSKLLKKKVEIKSGLTSKEKLLRIEEKD
ncbi:YggU family protein [Candidatus Woesearchaeota archaeon]|nr:YggU family protein [Candidatus Woesearchaeota archaeon]